MNGVKYHARIPGEHERIAERGMRRVREAIRTKIRELRFDLPLPFLPFLALHAVDCMNYIPNSRTAALMPMELVIGERVNYRTDILTLFGQLVQIQHNDVPTSTGIPTGKNEFALALGRVTNTKGSVWVYHMGQTRIVARRPIKAVPFPEEWIAHNLNELAAQKPINPKTMIEFRATLDYGASDKAEDLFEANSLMPTASSSLKEVIFKDVATPHVPQNRTIADTTSPVPVSNPPPEPPSPG